jgi:hypothetical protein
MRAASRPLVHRAAAASAAQRVERQPLAFQPVDHRFQPETLLGAQGHGRDCASRVAAQLATFRDSNSYGAARIGGMAGVPQRRARFAERPTRQDRTGDRTICDSVPSMTHLSRSTMRFRLGDRGENAPSGIRTRLTRGFGALIGALDGALKAAISRSLGEGTIRRPRWEPLFTLCSFPLLNGVTPPSLKVVPGCARHNTRRLRRGAIAHVGHGRTPCAD